MRVVLDTNVLVTALRSRHGAAFRLLRLVGTGEFEIVVSVPLVLEYEDALTRQLGRSPVSRQDIANVLDYLCSVGVRQEIFYLWRPLLRDPRDDMVLELAVAAGCDRIVTYNRDDFVGSERFGVLVVTPARFLHTLGELS